LGTYRLTTKSAPERLFLVTSRNRAVRPGEREIRLKPLP
jgi:hypothetical protein